jgi:hypothetical protein
MPGAGAYCRALAGWGEDDSIVGATLARASAAKRLASSNWQSSGLLIRGFGVRVPGEAFEDSR